jgi:ATP-dependent Clp protease ATP-binding subunit ClpA
VGTTSRLGFLGSCFVGLWVILGSVAHAGEPYDSLRAAIRYFDSSESSRNGSGDLPRIEALKGQAYEEVHRLAKKQIISECHASRLDSERLLAWLSVLDSMANSGDSRFFGWVKREITKNYSAHPDLAVLVEELNHFELNAKGATARDLLPSFEDMERSEYVKVARRVNDGISDETLKFFNGFLSVEKHKVAVAGTGQYLTMAVRQKQKSNTLVPVIGRDQEIDATIDVLLRMKGKAPVLLGDIGVGKSTVIAGIAERLLRGELPAGLHTERLKNSIVLVTDAARIAELVQNQSPRNLGVALEAYLDSVHELAKASRTNLIVVIEDAHELCDPQIDVLKHALDGGNAAPVILVADAKKAAFSLLAHDQFVTRIAPITIGELDAETTFQLIKTSSLPLIERHYGMRIPDEVIRAAIELSPDLAPDLRRPDGPIKLLQDAAIYMSRQSNGQAGEVTLASAYQLAAAKARLPVVPQDRGRFISVMDEIRAKIKSDVLGQDMAVDKIVDLFAATMTSKGRKVRAGVVVGTTGTGKSFIASRLAHHFYGTNTRMLEIDGNQLKTDDSGFYLFGPKSGYIGSDKNKGLLTNFFDGPGRGSGIIVVNELDKMHPQQVERLMEIIDTGAFIPGDGKHRKTGRVLWLFTSNKGATRFFPPDFVKNATREQVLKRLQGVSEAEIREAFTQQESFAKADEVLKPEVLSRMDAMILVAPILKEDALQIGRLKAEDEIKNLRSQGLGEIKVDELFVKSIVEENYDPAYGVRELERNIRTQIGELLDALTKRHGVFRSMTVTTLLPEPGTSTVRFQAVNERGEALVIQGPKLAFENPLFDPAEKQNLKNLEATLNSRVFGQTFYAKKLAESIQKSVVDAASKKPVSIYALGMTGNGKTEMARALAQARFGSQEFLCKLEMGQVSSVKDLSNIFQSSVGYVGSDQPGQFERFLQTHKKGVILFDEMGNAGGNDRNAKEEIGKYLYSILDDGIWVSPVTKKTYFLRDYIFMFTGNEAEKIFAGTSQDDLLRAEWKRYSSEEKARELLRQSGLSPAFVGRIGSVILTEPPVVQTKESIVRKLLGEWVARVETRQPVRIIHDDSFISLVSKLTYSPSEGARSVINFVDTTLGSASSQGIFEVDFTRATLENRAEVSLSLEAKMPSQPFFKVTPDETLAKLIVSVKQDGVEIAKIESDFTKSARFMKQIRMVDAYGTAFHEAGHAILNDPTTSGRILAHLTIIPGDDHLGYARYENLPGFKTNFTLTDLRARLATLVAGSEAELLVGREKNSGQKGDLKDERRLLTLAATEWGLVPELMGAKLDAEGNAKFSENQEKIFNRFADKEIRLARETARKFILDHWVLEYKVAEVLMNHGEISGAKFEEIRKEVAGMSPAETAIFRKINSPESVKARLSALDQESCQALMTRVRVKSAD